MVNTNQKPISEFLEKYFLHFNAASLVDAADEYIRQLEIGNKMMITMAGAMSTAEIGKVLAEMIRQDKVHIISCTGANLEEDVMNLVAHSHYKRVGNYRDLTPQDEMELLEKGLNRVTDTCIPEDEAFRRIQDKILKYWAKADAEKEAHFPHEYLYELLLSGDLEEHYEIDPKNSWMLAAAEKNLTVVSVGVDAEKIYDGASEVSDTVYKFDDVDSAAAWIRDFCKEGDSVLFKGSRTAGMENVMHKAFPGN